MCTGLRRNEKSCRLRWINYARPGLKRGNFSMGEEEVVIKLQAKLENKWSQIAMHLPGRTDNEVKNYCNSYLEKKVIRPQKQDSPPQTQELKGREEPSMINQGEDRAISAAVNHCNDDLPRVLFGDWLSSFDGGGSGGGLFSNLEEEGTGSAKNALHEISLGSSSKLELDEGDNGGGLVDMFPWCDDL